MAGYRQWLQAGANGQHNDAGVSAGAYNNLLKIVGNDGLAWDSSQKKAINPDMVMWGAYQKTQSQGHQSGAQAQAQDSNAQSQNYYTGGSSTSSAAAAKEAEQARFYQALLDSLGGRKQADRNRILDNYNNSLGSLAQQRDAAYSNLDREGSKLGDQRQKSLGQIQADTQTLLQGANTQLGMYGAGNSSATDMSAFGAADLANKSTADITDQYNEQMGDIALSRDNYKKEYDQEKNDLDQWQKDQVHDLDTKYTNLENDYRGKIGGQGNLDAVIQTFQSLKTPESSLKDLPEYKAEGIQSADLSGQVSAPNLSTGQAQEYFTGTTQANSKKKKNEGGYIL
jgi:hypothetical protein